MQVKNNNAAKYVIFELSDKRLFLSDHIVASCAYIMSKIDVTMGAYCAFGINQ